MNTINLPKASAPPSRTSSTPTTCPGVLDLGAPADEYDPEAEAFTWLIARGERLTPEVVAAVPLVTPGDRCYMDLCQRM
jgi:hypothetical protein